MESKIWMEALTFKKIWEFIDKILENKVGPSWQVSTLLSRQSLSLLAELLLSLEGTWRPKSTKHFSSSKIQCPLKASSQGKLQKTHCLNHLKLNWTKLQRVHCTEQFWMSRGCTSWFNKPFSFLASVILQQLLKDAKYTELPKWLSTNLTSYITLDRSHLNYVIN